jgi:hypothetical protein
VRQQKWLLGKLQQLFAQARQCSLQLTHFLQLVRDQEQHKNNPVEFVKGLLNLRDKYDAIVTQSFKEDKSFQKALKEVRPACYVHRKIVYCNMKMH